MSPRNYPNFKGEQMANDARKIVLTEEAAKYLRIPTETLVEWREKGVGPRYYDLDEFIRYSVADLNRWLNINSIETTWLMTDREDIENLGPVED